MMCQALEAFQEQHGVRIEKVTQIPLEGEGTISKRVDKCVQLQPFAYRKIIDSLVTEYIALLHPQIVLQLDGEQPVDGGPPCGRCNLGGDAFTGLHRFNTSARSTHSRKAHQDITDVGPLGERLGCLCSWRHESGSGLSPKGMLLGALWNPSRAPTLSKLEFSGTAIHSGKPERWPCMT